MLQDILLAVLAGIVYGLTHYAKHYPKEQFNPVKLLSTIVVAVGVAVSLALSGIRVDEMAIEQRFIIYAGLVPIVENIIKAILRSFKR